MTITPITFDHNGTPIKVTFHKARPKGTNPSPKHTIEGQVGTRKLPAIQVTTAELTAKTKVLDYIQSLKDEADNQQYPAALVSALTALGFIQPPV